METERDVSVLEHGCLAELLSAPGKQLRMSDLAAQLGTSPSAATRLVDRLIERGWVERESPPDNRRVVEVKITGEGRRAFVRNNRPFAAAVEDAVARRLDESEMAELVRLLKKVSR